MRPPPARRQDLPSWEFLVEWRAPSRGIAERTWDPVVEWAAAARDSATGAERELTRHVRDWERWLEPLGEVSAQDWREFRPLRLDREEGWSDWLAHLFARSSTGRFARELLQGHPNLRAVSEYAALQVQREVMTDGGERRADILIEWPDAAAHIEVKAGDRSFEKTGETGRLLEASYGRGRAWADLILLLPRDVSTWRAERREPESRVIGEVTWRDVAVALRRALRSADETLHWRTWAHAFCGAVEQRLLGCEPRAVVEERSSLERLASALTQLDVMKMAEE